MCKENGNGNGHSNGNGTNGTLTDKQELFVNAYLECFNATEAARRAQYQGNDSTLASVGYENLRKPHITDRISKRLQEAAMTADEVLARLAEIARGDHAQYVSNDGDVDIARMRDDGRLHLLHSVVETKYGKKYTFGSPQRALETLAKHHGLLVEKSEITLPDGIQVTHTFEQALARAYGEE